MLDSVKQYIDNAITKKLNTLTSGYPMRKYGTVVTVITDTYCMVKVSGITEDVKLPNYTMVKLAVGDGVLVEYTSNTNIERSGRIIYKQTPYLAGGGVGEKITENGTERFNYYDSQGSTSATGSSGCTLFGSQNYVDRSCSYSIVGGHNNSAYSGSGTLIIGDSVKCNIASTSLICGQSIDLTKDSSGSSGLVGNFVGSECNRSIICGSGIHTKSNGLSVVYSQIFGLNIELQASIYESLICGSDHTISINGWDSVSMSFIWGGYNTIGSGITYSSIGGTRNTITSGLSYTTIGGSDNIISKSLTGSIVYGMRNTVSDWMSGSALFGYDNVIGGSACVYGGSSNQLSLYQSIAVGTNLVDTTGSSSVALFGQYNIPVSNYRLVIGNGTNSSARANALTLYTTGNLSIAGSYSSGGADYAELHEWLDGNTEDKDFRGLFVTFDGDKIRLANAEDDYILGVISAFPAIVGNSYEDEWCGKFLIDIFGAPIYEDVQVPITKYEEYIIKEAYTDENGVEHPAETGTHEVETGEYKTEKHRKVNPEYDAEQVYVPRSQRQEYDFVGSHGKLVAIDDGTCEVNGYCYPSQNGIATKSTIDKGYRVLARIDDTHIKVWIR